MQVIKILYGTETDTALELAETLGESLETENVENEVVDMQDYEAAQLHDEALVVIITSTYGNGDPPFNARALLEALRADDMPRLEGLKFAVVGLGDSTYTNFCQCGKDFDKALGDLGAERIVPRRDIDGEPEDAFDEWRDAALPTLVATVS